MDEDLEDCILDWERLEPVKWGVGDYKGFRQGWFVNHTFIGSLPFFAFNQINKRNHKLKSLLSQTQILLKRTRHFSSTKNQDAFHVSILLQKILQRGKLPFSTLSLEETAIKENKVSRFIDELDLASDDVGYKIKKEFNNLITEDSILSVMSEKTIFKCDEEFSKSSSKKLFDSDLEKKFLNEWVPNNISKEAGHWFYVQPDLDKILRSNRDPREAKWRRIDFLYCHPKSEFPLAIEIDGFDHDPEMDRERDDALSTYGIKTIRIQNSEIIDGKGKNLEKLKEICLSNTSEKKISDQSLSVAKTIVDCCFGTKLQYAVSRGIELGWLEPNKL